MAGVSTATPEGREFKGITLANIPAFPAVVLRVLDIVSQDETDFALLVREITSDATLSAQVLRLANSPLFGPRYPVKSVLHALAVLGVRRLTGLVLTLSMSRFLKRASVGDLMRRSWRHNLACALAAKEFAHSFGRDANEAYNAGLFHDAGRLAFLIVDPRFYQTIAGCQVDLREMELAHFGVDHCDAGGWVIEQWHLPEAFAEVARHHHAPQPENGELTMLVNASCAVANRLGYSVVLGNAGEIEVDVNDNLCSSIADFIDSLEREYKI